MKVLIADDGRVRVRMDSNYLEQRGFQTTPVFDGMPIVMFSRRTMPAEEGYRNLEEGFKRNEPALATLQKCVSP